MRHEFALTAGKITVYINNLRYIGDVFLVSELWARWPGKYQNNDQLDLRETANLIY